MSPLLAFMTESLAAFPCADWEPCFAQLLGTRRAGFLLDPASTASGDALEVLRGRFASFGLSETAFTVLSAADRRAVVWFGDNRPSAQFRDAIGPRIVALRAESIRPETIRCMLDAGATHFLSDALPDELEADFRDATLRTWLECFVFLPPCTGAAFARSPMNGDRRVVVSEARTSRSLGPNELMALVAPEFGAHVIETAQALAELCDENARSDGLKSMLLATRDCQQAHLLMQAAARRGVGVTLSPGLRFSPLRFADWQTSSSQWLENAPPQFGPARRAGSLVQAFMRSVDVDRCSKQGPEECGIPRVGAAELANHVLESIGVGAESHGSSRAHIWRSGETWMRWFEASGTSRVPRRVKSSPHVSWLEVVGTPVLIDALAIEIPSNDVFRRWLEHAVATGRREFVPSVAAILAAHPGWVAIAEAVFAEVRRGEPGLLDLRGPLAGMLADLCWWDPLLGDDLGVPEAVLRWLEADDSESRQSNCFRVERAKAYARWRGIEDACAVLLRDGKLEPELNGALTAIVATKTWALWEDCYFPENRERFRPVFEQLRQLLGRERDQPYDAQTQKQKWFLEIHLGAGAEVARALKKGGLSDSMPAHVLAEVTMHLLYCGELSLATSSARLLHPRAGELQSPPELAFAASALELAGHVEAARGLYEKLERSRPGFWSSVEPFLQRTRSLVLAVRGDEALSRAMFWEAVSRRPALRSSRRLMEATIAGITGRQGFSFGDATFGYGRKPDGGSV